MPLRVARAMHSIHLPALELPQLQLLHAKAACGKRYSTGCRGKREDALSVRKKFLAREGDHFTLLNVLRAFGEVGAPGCGEAVCAVGWGGVQLLPVKTGRLTAPPGS